MKRQLILLNNCRPASLNAMITLLAFLCLSLVPLLARDARADGFYRWTTESGRTVYGSNPPSGARNVESLKGKSLSRYSSDKMLNRLGVKKQQQPQEKADRKQHNNSARELPITAKPVKLSQKPPLVMYDETGGISACKVSVENPTSLAAREVSVAFEFSDGTLIPAVGPATIEPNASAEYLVPEELLPLRISREGGATDAPPLPQVIIHGVSN